MTRRRLQRRLELVLPVPQVRIRTTQPGPQPAPTSREGSTGTPRHAIRCPDDLWGAAINRAAAEGRDLSSLMRGWLAAYVAGELPPADRRREP